MINMSLEQYITVQTELEIETGKMPAFFRFVTVNDDTTDNQVVTD
jgi:hypothetical protein